MKFNNKLKHSYLEETPEREKEGNRDNSDVFIYEMRTQRLVKAMSNIFKSEPINLRK